MIPNSRLLQQFDVNGPRYTSYPTANQFKDISNLKNKTIENLISAKNSMQSQNFSLYIHIPFCKNICFYCACNKIITRDQSVENEYIRHLYLEIDQYHHHLGKLQISNIHFGGGTPTFISDDKLSNILDYIKSKFNTEYIREISIEIDPRTVSSDRLLRLKNIGFNRISFGVQDFDDNVQKAVNRIQSFDEIKALVKKAKDLDYASTNIDLIYGLPMQNIDSFKVTLSRVLSLMPERIALYSYAHLPHLFKSQIQIQKHKLPNASDKILMLRMAITELLNTGYHYIGMDHFALAHDSLSIAKSQQRLFRNFQGYTDKNELNLIPLGVSSIGQVGGYYFQNAKNLDEYYQMLDSSILPIKKELQMNFDDTIRRAVIMEVMCHGYVEFKFIEDMFLIKFNEYFSSELLKLKEIQSTVVRVGKNKISLGKYGWYFVRVIAMIFDKYLDRSKYSFSKAI